MPVFSHYNGSLVPSYFPAVNCTEKFKGESPSLLDNLWRPAHEDVVANTGWVCPDVGSMTLENYYGDINVSSFYWYGIYYCDEAASMLGYSDLNCETNHTLTNQVMTDATSIV